MTATAADYAWFETRLDHFAQAYCLTLARGLEPREFLTRIGARPLEPLTGLDALFEPSMDAWDENGGAETLIGVTTVTGDGGPWTLGVEVNGYLGVTPELVAPVSAGTMIVSHFSNINADSIFYWIEDGDIRLEFDPLLGPAYREGSTPDAVTDLMQAAGFDLTEDGDNTENCTTAALALAERLTGVRLTPELLEQATYTCGMVQIPSD
jgi:hypothetical protein